MQKTPQLSQWMIWLATFGVTAWSAWNQSHFVSLVEFKDFTKSDKEFKEKLTSDYLNLRQDYYIYKATNNLTKN